MQRLQNRQGDGIGGSSLGFRPSPVVGSELVDDYRNVSWLFLRLLALIYLAAFASLAVQITGLAGADGILPFHERLQQVAQLPGWQRYWHYPTLFWFSSSDLMLQGVAYAGCLFSLTLLFNRMVRSSLILLFACYLSLFHAGQVFMNFQWDYLLLEAGFLAIFLPGGSRLVIWLFRWLLFRLRFLSGISKLVTQDPTWSGFTALGYYFETQPLPHIGAWYAHQLPEWVLRTGVGAVFFVELLVPFMMLLPRRFRLFAAGATVLMQILIILTSNHNFFNLLTIVLCLFLIDDRALQSLLPARLHRGLEALIVPAVVPRSGVRQLIFRLAAAVILVVSLFQVSGFFVRPTETYGLARLQEAVRPFYIVNRYHVFPTITTRRIELVVEGSRDGERWLPYEFRYKPGDPAVLTPVVIPHHPRLDWMIWFVPLGHPMNYHWFDRFLQQLHANSPAVTSLLGHNPFQESPPKYLRVQAYRYRFVNPLERQAGDPWWQREYQGPFFFAPRQ
ncbi:MAG: lipase maturation factor family protein [Sedimenticola sp.]